MTKIYTKQGDRGETGYIGGRLSKVDPLITLIGEIDELNSLIGVCKSQSEFEELSASLEKTQNQLLSIGSFLADKDGRIKFSIDWDKWMIQMEKDIDSMDARLDELWEFILPGGSTISALLHHARSVCRRVERNAVKLIDDTQDKRYEDTIRYLNRLSDYLFVIARYANKLAGVLDTKWEKESY